MTETSKKTRRRSGPLYAFPIEQACSEQLNSKVRHRTAAEDATFCQPNTGPASKTTLRSFRTERSRPQWNSQRSCDSSLNLNTKKSVQCLSQPSLIRSFIL